MTDQPGRIVVAGLSKNFGKVRAVDNLSFTVEPGSVTGFLGPNGAGKTTTLRMLLGLVTPTSGHATIGGVRYPEIPYPMRQVGAVLEASSFHPGRTARNHLRVYAAASGIPDSRADEVLGLVGLTEAAKRKTRGFSLGMRQRLGLAFALLGNPRVLLLDEPANGLDPEGILWLRGFLRAMAGEGRTVLVSSHLLSEVQQTADRVVILSQGRLVREGTVAELSAGIGETVSVTSPQIERLAAALAGTRAEVVRSGPATLAIRALDAAAVGHAAFTAGIELHELRTERADLERLFFSLTQGEYAAPAPGSPLPPDGYVSGQVPPPGRIPFGPPGQAQGPPPGGFPPRPDGFPPGSAAPSGPQQNPGGAR
ncbi:MAG TPA: ABC transporter ATP-binding protein [Mycobacteriales bacterium]